MKLIMELISRLGTLKSACRAGCPPVSAGDAASCNPGDGPDSSQPSKRLSRLLVPSGSGNAVPPGSGGRRGRSEKDISPVPAQLKSGFFWVFVTFWQLSANHGLPCKGQEARKLCVG